MPCFRPEELRAFGYRLFGAAGCGPEESRVVVDHLVEAALMGHDSHGIIRFYEYMRQIRAGTFTPGARPTVIREAPCVAQVDGNGAMGQVAGAFAAELAIEKARAHGVGVVSLRNCSHLGRIGAYPMLAAQVGMLGLAYVNAGRLGYQIAPFGGIDGKLSTNPISFAAPRRNADPILVDLTASVIAEGKLRVAINAGKPVPEGWIIDHAGRPTTNPNDYKADPPGAILPLGGVAAHKGYGLGFMVELLAGALSGQGTARGERVMQSNGLLFTVYRIEFFLEQEAFYDEVESLIAHIRTSRLAPGFSEILAPGEPEFRTARRRSQEGIEVDSGTWEQVCVEAARLGVVPLQ